VTLDVIFRATLLFTASLAAYGIARRATAATRHAILACTLGAALLLPFANWRGRPTAVVAVSMPSEITKATAASLSRRVDRSPHSTIDLTRAMKAVWFTGIVFFALRYGFAWIASERLRRTAGTRTAFRGATVVTSNAVRSPLTAGIVRPVVLVPEGEVDEAALVHELAHIRRRDALTRLLAHCASTIYWFHPLVWVLAALAWLEQERACDDAVLAEGVDAVRYATLLVQSARDHSAAALAFGGSQLRSRIVSIVERGRNRNTLTWRAALAIPAIAFGATAGAATLSIALLGPIDLPTSEELPDVALTKIDATSPADQDTAQKLLQLAAKSKTWEGDLVAQRARWGLSQMRDGRLLEPLRAALGDRDWRVRAYAAWCLAVAHDSAAVPQLVPLLRDPVWRMRAMAASALADIADPRASGAMADVIDDDAWQVRVEAVRYLGDLKDARFRPLLRRHLNDPHVAVREQAQAALASR
jgi:beta-lactamase regulating signal transducer with metallopeptidase domain